MCFELVNDAVEGTPEGNEWDALMISDPTEAARQSAKALHYVSTHRQAIATAGEADDENALTIAREALLFMIMGPASLTDGVLVGAVRDFEAAHNLGYPSPEVATAVA